MIRKYVLPVLALLGVIFGIFMVKQGAKKPPVAPAVVQPSYAEYHSEVAGAGLVEASTQNIAVATPVAGVVTGLFVKVGDAVKAGQPLFKLDDRNLQASVLVQKAAIASAQAKVKVEQALLADLNNQLQIYQSVADTRAVSREELDRKRFAVLTGDAQLESARAEIAAADAQLKAVQIDIQRLTVAAPVDGRVLQINLRLGEFAQAGPATTPLMLLGNTDQMNVRVDVDENDAWKVRADAPAIAKVRGKPDARVPLAFVRIEPYVIPKKSLTGDSTERVDTRVLQVIYRIDGMPPVPVYVGQQMDVSISTTGVLSTTRPAGTVADAAESHGEGER